METEKPSALCVVSLEQIQQVKRKEPKTRQLSATGVVEFLIAEFLKEGVSKV